MIEPSQFEIVARAIRVEVDEEKDEFYLVFKIVDPNFKEKIREDWLQGIELELIERRK